MTPLSPAQLARQICRLGAPREARPKKRPAQLRFTNFCLLTCLSPRPRRAALLLLLLAGSFVALSRAPSDDPRLKNSSRRAARNGWIYVHLQGKPSEVGFQHGWWLAPEIRTTFQDAVLVAEHDTKRPWSFFRETAEKMLWPRIETEYREELQGIVDGLKARGEKLDLWDIVAHNAFEELPGYYVPWLNKREKREVAGLRGAPESCSAFVATGAWTRDGRVVVGHNNWSDYVVGQNWNILFDIAPASGHRIFMDGIPGIIASDDDFGVNSAGLIITETTISRFHGFDPDGIPEFVRARKAMQYSSSIDDFDRIMRQGNNGGYANAWLLADRKTNEIARLELGLKNVTLERTRDGYFVGANFPVSEKLTREETTYDPKDPAASGNARRARWEQLMAEYKGKIDVAAGQKFLADHYDTYARSQDPGSRTLCGHVELSREGLPDWQPPFGPAGAVQSKVTDAAMAGRLAFTAAMGHACGRHFRAAEHLRRHPEFAWLQGRLRDLTAHPWTTFSASSAPTSQRFPITKSPNH